MVAIQRFRSTWGVPPGDNYKAWEEWFPRLKAQGYGRLSWSCLGELLAASNDVLTTIGPQPESKSILAACLICT